MFVMALLKMYKETSSHKMLIATTEPGATTYSVPLEYK